MGGDDLQQTLVQKRDGRHYLLLWRDVDVATAYPDAAPVAVDGSRVTVLLRPRRPVAVYQPARSADPLTVQSGSSDRIAVDVRGDLLVLEIG